MSSMEKKTLETTTTTPQAKTTIIRENENNSDHKLQPPTNSISQSSPKDVRCKPATTPDRLKVPKAFKYPERYTSPTDLMMSPVSRGILARSRKPNGLLPPSKIHPKNQNFQLQQAGLFQ